MTRGITKALMAVGLVGMMAPAASAQLPGPQPIPPLPFPPPPVPGPTPVPPGPVPPLPNPPGPIPQPQPDQQWRLGVTISANYGGGVRIHQVFPGSPAEQIGLRPGMVIYTVDGQLLSDPMKARDKIIFQSGDTIVLVYQDGGRFNQVSAQLTTTTIVATAAAPGAPPVATAAPKVTNIRRVPVTDPRR